MNPSTDIPEMEKQPIRQNWLHKLLHKHLRIPRPMIQPFLMAVKIAGSPGQYRLRKRYAKESLASTKKRLIIPNKDGYRFFEGDDIPGIDALVRYCTRVYEESRTLFSPEYLQKHPTKRFLLPILEGAEFCRHPQLIQFMVSRPILDSVTGYLGTIPRLVGARLCWSPPNETARSSQLFHFDYEDLTQLKVFVNIFETKEDQGPLTFIPADVSEHVQKSIRRVSRVSDERIYKAGARNKEVKLIGPAGSGAFLDTSRCLHYGSRFNRRDRLVLIIQFLNIHTAYQSTAPFQVPPDLQGLDLDSVQKLALGIH
ncbi:MAG: hypothetical protein O7F12_14685 [Nitrospirae bacterium]|nr:hypothetical protein [Nitrospirota bacterium]